MYLPPQLRCSLIANRYIYTKKHLQATAWRCFYIDINYQLISKCSVS